MQTATTREQILAAWCHGSILLTGFVGPLVIWLTKKDEYPLVNKNGREALNLLVTLSFALTIGVLLVLFPQTHTVGMVLFYLLTLAAAVLIVVATVQIYGGNSYRYPYIFRLIAKQ